MSTNLTKEEVQGILPRGTRHIVSDELMTVLNNIGDPDVAERYRDNFLDYSSILAEGRYKLTDYAHAVRFITYRLMDMSLTAAWCRTFPEKHQGAIDRGKDKDHIHAMASAYNKSKLVSTLFEKSMIPVHLVNADIHQKAINKLAMIMADPDATHRSQIDAANALLVHLKAPEVAKMQLDVTMKDDRAIEDLKNATAELALKQKMMLENSIVSVQEVAESKLVTESIGD